DGIDGIFIGPSDLSTSMGYAGNSSHPEVVAAVEDAITRIRKAGKPAGILTPDKAFARRCIELGTLFTAVDVDSNILIQNADRIAREFKGG
ncbi:MAG TPA: aldolase/citrate lyase family protein, partial [Pararhizobium sp.]|nr:aldolase/citrate lyase family protein [Pararhizobium sp.]